MNANEFKETLEKAVLFMYKQQAEIESLQEEVKKYEKHIAVRYLEELQNE